MENHSLCHSSLHSLLLSLLLSHPHHPPFLLSLLFSSNISFLHPSSSLSLHSSFPPNSFKNNDFVFPLSSLCSFLFDSLSSKSLYFIRHAESTYNSWRSSSCFNLPCFYANSIENHDPSLTLNGIQQVKAASQKLYENEEGRVGVVKKKNEKKKEKGSRKEKEREGANGKKEGKGLNEDGRMKKEVDKNGENERKNNGEEGKKSERKKLFDVTYVSPLTRALQTCELLGEIEEKVIVTDLLRERLDFACDIGKEKNKLEINFKKFDFTYVDKGSWWLEKQEEVEWNEGGGKSAPGDKKEGGGRQKEEEKKGMKFEKNKKKVKGYRKEGKANVMRRVLLMLIWALSSKEEKILFVSHSNIYKIMFGCDIFEKKIKNAEIVKFEKEHLVKFLKKIEPLFRFKNKKG